MATSVERLKQQSMYELSAKKNGHCREVAVSEGSAVFYSSVKTTQGASVHLDLIKNWEHRQSVAKLRSRNHDLRIETARHCALKIPENARIQSKLH